MKKHVIVIGGGVIGLSTAYALIRAGHQVTLVESNDKVAHQTSFANGGQLSYRYVAPLADAGVPLQAISWLGKTHSPLNFKLKFSLSQWSWLLQFMMACNRKDNITNANHILRLSLLSQKVMSEWRMQLDDFCWEKSGKLIIHRQIKPFYKASLCIDSKVQTILSRDEAIELEPSLKGIENELIGAIYTPDDETADCYKFCNALYKKLNQHTDFKILFKNKVQSMIIENNEIIAIETEQRRIHADEFVVAAGNGSREIFSKVGISVPLYPLKGYSLTLAFPQQAGVVPKTSMTDYANKIVYAKLGDKLRIAAMVDIGYEHIDIRQQRIKGLKNTIRQTFPELEGLDSAEQWSGLRPSTPKGPPLLGRTKYKNLWSNIGQGSLGFTLAAGSALVLTQLISQSTSPIRLDGLILNS